MDLDTLFSELQEPEIEVNRLAKSEWGYKKKNWLALKVKEVKDKKSEDEKCQNESDEDMDLLFENSKNKF